jgi:hypothetical protein
MKDYDKIFNSILYIPPILITIVVCFLYGFEYIGLYLWLFLGWCIFVIVMFVIKFTIGDVIIERIQDYQMRLKLENEIINIFSFQKKTMVETS